MKPITDAEIEAVARGIYAARPFVMASTETTFGAQMCKSFDWDSAPAYYQDDMRQLARAAITAYQGVAEADPGQTAMREAELSDNGINPPPKNAARVELRGKAADAAWSAISRDKELDRLRRQASVPTSNPMVKI